MNGEIHKNLVLYRKHPKPGNAYRQIVVIELSQQFIVHILDGDVIQSDPKFDATSEEAGVFFHSDLQSALDDATKEFDASVKSGWIPYVGP
jgi:hypothetical protein